MDAVNISIEEVTDIYQKIISFLPLVFGIFEHESL